MSTRSNEIPVDSAIKYFLISFSDLLGVQRAKLIPAKFLPDIREDGARFAGHSTWLDIEVGDADLIAVPDIDAMVRLPWNEDIAWLPSDLWLNGRPVEHGPRNVLHEVVDRAQQLGYEMKTGVECEFFLLTGEGTTIADHADRQIKPGYDQQALMRRFDLVDELCQAMERLGWEPYQNDHEDANGQFELNWRYESALLTADRHTFFKYMVRSLAEQRGMRATFMPKPFGELTGNGCHVHVSLWRDGKNLFEDRSDNSGISNSARHFIGGIMHSAAALCALLNPTVNSYKRLGASRTNSGPTWAPDRVSCGGNDRTAMIRIPNAGRFELRLADGAANPYLLQAAILAAGLDGIEAGRDPVLVGSAEQMPRLPATLLDALRAFEASEVMHKAFGSLVPAYVRLRRDEWDTYNRQITDWERLATLDC